MKDVSRHMETESAINPSGGVGVTGPTDGELVGQVMAGRRQAFDELIRRYQRQALAVSYRLLGNSDDAQEVTQDAFLKAFTSLRTLQQHEAFKGWLMRIVSNLSLNKRRGRRAMQHAPIQHIGQDRGLATLQRSCAQQQCRCYQVRSSENGRCNSCRVAH